MKPLINRYKALAQFGEYLISGGIYFWISYGTFALFWSVLGWSLWWAVITSSFIGWIVNFLMQRYWVFKSSNLKGHQTQVTGRYIFITAVNFVLGYLFLYELKRAGLTPYLGQFVSAGFFTIWNWFWYRYWVFPSSATRKPTITPARLLLHIPHGARSV